MRSESRPTGGEGETVRKVRKKSGATVGKRDSMEGSRTTAEEEKERRTNNSGGREGADGSASGGVCEVGVRPLSLPPDKHRFAYDRHFAGSII